MNRRDFIRRMALAATGAIAADQIELLERLTHRRRFFPSAAISDYDQWNISAMDRIVSEAIYEIGPADVSNWTATFTDQHGRTWVGEIVKPLRGMSDNDIVVFANRPLHRS